MKTCTRENCVMELGYVRESEGDCVFRNAATNECECPFKKREWRTQEELKNDK